MNAETLTLDHRITNSQLGCASTCLRKHAIAYLHGVRPASDAAPLRFGATWARALDRRSMGSPLETNLTLVRSEYDIAKGANDERNAVLGYECETVCTLLNLYDWRWHDADASKVVIASEEPFEVPIINPDTNRESRTFVYAGKLDRRVTLPDGRMAIEENKTTASDIQPGSDYWLRLRVDTQIARYALAARHLGHPIDTVLYDVTKKPTIRPGTVPLMDAEGFKIVHDCVGNRVKNADGKRWRQTGDSASGYTLQTRPETPAEWGQRLHESISANPDAYFARREIPRTDMDLTEAQRDLWDSAQVLHSCDLANRWPRNSQACVGFGRCSYLDLCASNWNPATAETVPEGFVRVGDAHQELVGSV